jgi:DNA repair exonuclease SbcCD nuclease subunit
MRKVKFIHCADLHLGSPFKGISSTNTALGAALSAATFDAFRNIIDLAVKHKVDFLLIAGDVFDSEDQSLHSRLFFKKQLERLAVENISCFIVCGNHDPLPSWSKTLGFPSNTTIFEAGQVQTAIAKSESGSEIAAISGISFGTNKVTANLAKKFKSENPDILAIALLHANIENSSTENYAPAKLSDLETGGFDYWALGHVHSFKVLKEAFPAVVYPGCPQGTSPRETGEKGCCLIEIEKGQVPVIKALAVDQIRYHKLELDLSAVNTFEKLFELVNIRCEQIIETAGGHRTVLRLRLTGRTDLNRELRAEFDADELDEHLNEEVGAFGEMLFLNHVEVATCSRYDIESLKGNSGFVADLLVSSGETVPDDVAKELNAVYKKCRCLPKFEENELREIIADAEYLALDKLLDELDVEGAE